jgi:hypothetical protein
MIKPSKNKILPDNYLYVCKQNWNYSSPIEVSNQELPEEKACCFFPKDDFPKKRNNHPETLF